jgi:6-oxo-cyclohex-1-ene-carbonyl-CoA hydrolase
MLDPFGRVVYGDWKTGAELEQAKALMARARTDLSRLDAAVERLCTRLLMLMPECVSKTVASVRKHKQHHWDANSIGNLKTHDNGL